MFRIAEFARIAGVSPRMLRKWDALGLFRPAWIDADSGYRAYSPAQLPELRRVLALRDLGMPLAQIADLRGGAADLRAALEQRRDELERSRREVDRRLQALDIGIAMADRPDGLDVVVRPVAADRVAVRQLVVGEDDATAFYELEAYVRDLGRRRSAPPGETELDGKRAIFVPVTGPVPATTRIRSHLLPAVQAATVVHRGDYDGLGAARDALKLWVAAAGLRPVAPLRILYLQFGAEAELRVPPRYLVDSAADLVTEVQVPVA